MGSRLCCRLVLNLLTCMSTTAQHFSSTCINSHCFIVLKKDHRTPEECLKVLSHMSHGTSSVFFFLAGGPPWASMQCWWRLLSVGNGIEHSEQRCSFPGARAQPFLCFIRRHLKSNVLLHHSQRYDTGTAFLLPFVLESSPSSSSESAVDPSCSTSDFAGQSESDRGPVLNCDKM